MCLKHLTVVVRINTIATSTQTSVKQPYAFNYKIILYYILIDVCAKKRCFLRPVII